MFRTSKAFACFAVSAFSCMSLSCSPRKYNQSETQHTLNEPIYAADGIQWSSPNHADFAKFLGMGRTRFLKDNDPLVKRLQFWVDAIDSRVRANTKQDMSMVPKPIVKVADVSTINAFVAGYPACYSVPVSLNPNASVDKQVETVLFQPSTFKATVSVRPCEGFPGDQAHLQKFVNLVQQQLDDEAKKECNLTLRDGTLHLEGRSCVSESYGRANSFMTVSSANFVTVLGGLLKQVSEEEALATIAHELGHYYRSHTTGTKNRDVFFYEMGAENPSKRPSATTKSDLVALGRELEELSDLGFVESDHSLAYDRTVTLATLGKHQGEFSLLYFILDVFGLDKSMAQRLPEMCGADQDCKKQCQDLEHASLNGNFQHLLARSWGPETAEEKALYASVEEKLGSCAEKVHINSDKYSQEIVLRYLPNELAKQLRSVKTATHANLLNAFQFASQETKKLHEKWLADLQKAQQQKLGYYTSEQEADDFSVEVLASLNVDPQAAVDLDMKLLSLNKHYDESGMSWAQCKKALANGWRDENGQTIQVPIGGWNEVHHSSCYRAYNISRELKAHKYTIDPSQRPTAPGNRSWDSLLSVLTHSGKVKISSESAQEEMQMNDLCRSGLVRCL